MLDVIFALKFIHVLAAAAMFGGWLCLAVIVLLGHRSGNPSVLAVVAQFAVTLEKTLILPAVIAQPIVAFPLGWAIGLSFGEFWILWSLALYALTVVCWIAAFYIETRIRRLSRHAALSGIRLPDEYQPLFRIWSALAPIVLMSITATMALMVWQPRFD
jgi:uncharacterized membrane protein